MTKDDDAAAGKRQAEVALENLRRAGVTPEEISLEVRAQGGRDAVAGMAKVVANLPPKTNQQAVDQAKQIWGAFVAMAMTNGATPALTAIAPVVKTYRQNVKRRHLTDYGMLKALETALALAHDPPSAEAALVEILSNLGRMDGAPPGRVM